MRRQTRKKRRSDTTGTPQAHYRQRHDLPTRLSDIRDAVVSMLHCARQLLLARIETPGACASILSGTRRLSLFCPAARLILSRWRVRVHVTNKLPHTQRIQSMPPQITVWKLAGRKADAPFAYPASACTAICI